MQHRSRRRHGWSGCSARPAFRAHARIAMRARSSMPAVGGAPASSVSSRRAPRHSRSAHAASRSRDAAAHLGRRRLGVGEAEDLLGRHAAQQQPQHARSQHIGLARAGIGRHPHRTRRVGRAPLARGDRARASGGGDAGSWVVHPRGQRPLVGARQMIVVARAAACGRSRRAAGCRGTIGRSSRIRKVSMWPCSAPLDLVDRLHQRHALAQAERPHREGRGPRPILM